jgi:hypothetical protein
MTKACEHTLALDGDPFGLARCGDCGTIVCESIHRGVRCLLSKGHEDRELHFNHAHPAMGRWVDKTQVGV